MFDLPAGIVDLITGAGGALVALSIAVYLFVKNVVHAARPCQAALERQMAQADGWKAAYEEERRAHQIDREALAVASDRAEVAVETARVQKLVLEEMRIRWEMPRSGRGHVDEEP